MFTVIFKNHEGIFSLTCEKKSIFNICWAFQSANNIDQFIVNDMWGIYTSAKDFGFSSSAFDKWVKDFTYGNKND